jgi:hypothetical protein
MLAWVACGSGLGVVGDVGLGQGVAQPRLNLAPGEGIDPLAAGIHGQREHSHCVMVA